MNCILKIYIEINMYIFSNIALIFLIIVFQKSFLIGTTSTNESENNFQKTIISILEIGKDTVDTLDKFMLKVNDSIEIPYNTSLSNLTTEIDNIQDIFAADNIRFKIINTAKWYLSEIEILNETLTNIKEQVLLFTMHLFRENSEATNKIHNLMREVPSKNLSIFIQYMYKNPRKFQNEKNFYDLNQNIEN